MGYLKNNEINLIVDVFEKVQGQNYRPQTRDNYLSKINRDYCTKHLSSELNNQFEQLRTDLRILNEPIQLNTGEIPLHNWLKEAERRFGSIQEGKLFKELLKKVPAKSPNEVINPILKSTSQYEKITEFLQSKIPIRNYNLIIGVILIIVFIPLKFAIEQTNIGHWFEIRSYEVLQSTLSKYDPNEKLPVTVLDISNLQTDATGAVPPDKLQELVEGLIESGAKAIAINIKFTPRVDRVNSDNTGLRHKDDYDFFDYILEQKAKGIPIYVGVHQFDAEPASWLGSTEYIDIAADLTICTEDECKDTREIPVWLQCEGYKTRLNSISKALATHYEDKPQPPNWLNLFLKDYEDPENLKSETVKDKGKTISCNRSYRLVNYAKLKLMENLSQSFTTKDAIIQANSKFKDKLVIIGKSQLGKTTSSFKVIGQTDVVPGTMIQAMTTYTLVSDPVYKLKAWFSIFLDFLIGLFLVLGLFIFNLWKGKDNDSFSQRGEGIFLGSSILVVFFLGIITVKFFNILWVDFLLVILAIFLHSKIQNGVFNYFRKYF